MIRSSFFKNNIFFTVQFEWMTTVQQILHNVILNILYFIAKRCSDVKFTKDKIYINCVEKNMNITKICIYKMYNYKNIYVQNIELTEINLFSRSIIAFCEKNDKNVFHVVRKHDLLKGNTEVVI